MMVSCRFRFILSLILFFSLVFTVPFEIALAQSSFTFDVNTTSDIADSTVGDGVCGSAAGPCSLRAAFQELNSHAGFSATIHLPAGTYTLNLPGTLETSNSVTLVGAGADTTIIQRSMPNVDRVFRTLNGGINVTITGVTLQGGALAGDGGGIYNNGASLTLDQVAVKTNTIFGSKGGGIFNTNSGVLTITRSTVSNNSNSDGGFGGGIYNDGGTVNITNSTISANTSPFGGGIVNNGGSFTLTNCTLGGDTGASGNEIQNLGGSVTLKNTIVSNTSTTPNCSGTITANGHNLESGNTCGLTGTGDLPNKDPLLGPLQNNGGPTFTLALSGSSPALDAGDSNGCPSTDQRGITRPQGRSCDLGAFELEGGGGGGGGGGSCSLGSSFENQPSWALFCFMGTLILFRFVLRLTGIRSF